MRDVVRTYLLLLAGGQVRPPPPSAAADFLAATREGEAIEVWWEDAWWRGVLLALLQRGVASVKLDGRSTTVRLLTLTEHHSPTSHTHPSTYAPTRKVLTHLLPFPSTPTIKYKVPTTPQPIHQSYSYYQLRSVEVRRLRPGWEWGGGGWSAPCIAPNPTPCR